MRFWAQLSKDKEQVWIKVKRGEKVQLLCKLTKTRLVIEAACHSLRPKALTKLRLEMVGIKVI